GSRTSRRTRAAHRQPARGGCAPRACRGRPGGPTSFPCLACMLTVMRYVVRLGAWLAASAMVLAGGGTVGGPIGAATAGAAVLVGWLYAALWLPRSAHA